MIIVAPTEPLALRSAADRVSLFPEKMGADVLIVAGGARVGVQRKEVKDLLASLDDGRLAGQLAQMRNSNLDCCVVLIEGEVRFDNAGRLAKGPWGREVRIENWTGLVWSLQEVDGVRVVSTPDVAGTVRWVRATEKWWQKGRDAHKGVRGRGKGPKGAWGTRQSWEWGAWVLSSWPGIGPELAERIMVHFGTLPLEWTCSPEELSRVPGISLERARKWISPKKS